MIMASPFTLYRYGTTPQVARAVSGDSRRARFAGLSDSDLATVGAALSVAGAGLGAYHGYKRDNSIGWAIGWAILGATFPIVTIPVAIAQGFGQPKAGA
jgi:hypothetical protein